MPPLIDQGPGPELKRPGIQEHLFRAALLKRGLPAQEPQPAVDVLLFREDQGHRLVKVQTPRPLQRPIWAVAVQVHELDVQEPAAARIRRS